MNRRELIRKAFGALAAAFVPAGAALAGMPTPDVRSPVAKDTPGPIDFLWEEMKWAVGTPERGTQMARLRRLVDKLKREEHQVVMHYGTVTGERTGWVTTVDAIFVRANNGNYIGIADPALSIHWDVPGWVPMTRVDGKRLHTTVCEPDA
jgi:hypothetical protein